MDNVPVKHRMTDLFLCVQSSQMTTSIYRGILYRNTWCRLLFQRFFYQNDPTSIQYNVKYELNNTPVHMQHEISELCLICVFQYRMSFFLFNVIF